MNNREEIKYFDDIKLSVDSFYGNMHKGNLLKDIFNDVMRDRCTEHLEKMHRFWLPDKHTYYGGTFVPHAQLPFEQQHFGPKEKIKRPQDAAKGKNTSIYSSGKESFSQRSGLQQNNENGGSKL